MFKVQYFEEDNMIKQLEYSTLNEAENALKENDIWNDSTSYKILDENDVEIENKEIDNEDIDSINSTRDMMFPDEGSEEGFDVDDFFDNE